MLYSFVTPFIAARRSALARHLLYYGDVAVCVSVALIMPKRLSRSLCDVYQIAAQPF